MQREHATSLANLLVRATPAGSIACIFAGGSLGRGEVWAAEVDGGTQIYSDIDLYVVAQNEGAVNRIKEQVLELRDRMLPPGFLKAPDIGVYTRTDLLSQPLRPGTAELDTHHMMLYGDESIPRGLRDRSAAHIAPEEALYLIENRVRELTAPSSSRMGPDFERLELVAALKTRLDVYSAHAIAEGTFAPTLKEREQRFRTEPPRTLDSDASAFVAEGFAAARDVRAWVLEHRAGDEMKRSLHALITAWRALAPRVLGGDAPAAELVARRCRTGAIAPNARDVLRLRRRLARSLASIVPAIAVLDRRSPVDALRVDALARCLAMETGSEHDFAGHFAYIDRLTHQFGFNDGSIEERARRMQAAIS